MNASKRRLRILYLSPPWPYKSIRSLHVARALQHVGDIDRVIVHAEHESPGATLDVGRGFNVAYELDVHPRPHTGFLKKFRLALDSRARFPHGMSVSDEGSRRLLRTTQDYDLIWIFKLRTANMFDAFAWPKSVLDIDDLPSGYYQTALGSTSSVREKLLHSAQILSWRLRERQLANRFVTLAVCSEGDRRRIRATTPVHVIPNGFELPGVRPIHSPSTPVRIGFIGLFDYTANFDGVKWFVKRCWPLIKRQLPEARVRLVGRGSDGPIATSGPDIDGLGWVDDSADEIATWSLMIIPLHIGGGTRVKLAEGFSRKCPIVSTGVGAYGYEVENGKQLRLADSPEEFARACVEIVRNPSEAARMADRAWSDFVTKWTWDAIAPRVWAAAEDSLKRSVR